MDFEAALRRHPPVSAVGDIRLRYETSLLVAERVRGFRSDLVATIWFLSSIVFGLCGFLSILSTGSPIAPGVGFVIGAASSLALGVRRQQSVRARQGFALSFATESLRLDGRTFWLGSPRTRVVPFDAVQSVAVERGAAGYYSLWVELASPPSRARLIDRVRPAEIDELRRLSRFLEGAFGLRKPGPDAQGDRLD